MKKRVLVASEYPAVQDLILDDNKIFIKTYLRKNGKQEYIVLDFEGKILNSVFLPIVNTSLSPLKPKLYAIRNYKYYYLKENEDTENYELFCKKIE